AEIAEHAEPMRTTHNKRTTPRRAGFTLTEMLVATAITIIFGSMAVATLRYGSGLWRGGNRRGLAYDKATIIFQQLEDDLGAARNPFWNRDADAWNPDVRFYVDWDTSARQRLRFVRSISEHTLNPRLRQAGDGQDNDIDVPPLADEEWYNLRDDDDPPDGRIDEDLRALGGMCEVAYLMGLDATDQYTLHRAVLGPIGYDEPVGWVPPPAEYPGYSLFNDDPGNIDNDVFGTAQRIRDKAVALATGVLHFEVRCWSQYTTTWDDIGWAQWTLSYVPETCGPVTYPVVWDSRMGTVNNPHDDMFPRAVMAVVVVDPSEQFPERRPVRLDLLPTETLLAAATIIPIPPSSTIPTFNPAWPYLLIEDPDNGNEWVRYSHFDEATSSFRVDPLVDPRASRGVRGTVPMDHTGPRRVRIGFTFSRVFYNPAGKEYWG
ncbi:MAG: prepilin-type N-terminal cleavage/methylation domain-containing protein, partial [Candidatus Brocadiae bacterium]|nr:prepilin-type N-terminal cleavage/methylation domain-containing protein [Candidatus Brocadiia bacterium]